jgi:hypothetical protein
MSKADPMSVPMVFLRVGWMDRYHGLSGDSITGGGEHVDENNYGLEILNFLPFHGKVFGYVRPPSPKESWARATIDIDRISGTKSGNEINGVLVVWVATDPLARGGHVVGWYKNATVHRCLQDAPGDRGRTPGGEEFQFYVEAKATDAVCLPPDARPIKVPKIGEGGFGNANLLYADDPTRHREFRRDVLRFIKTRAAFPANKNKATASRQSDPLLRQKIELVAVKHTTTYYRRLGYVVSSQEKDNVGWDLTAARGKRELRLEVKGLSGSQIVVELTPNEYSAMTSYQESYRVCVVTTALVSPKLEVFAYSSDAGGWESLLVEGRALTIEKIVAARCTATH